MKTITNNVNPSNKFVTIRGKKVLDLFAHEYSSKEIASELYVGYDTLQTHRKSLLRKLAVKNTAGMVRVGFEQRLLILVQQLIMTCFILLTFNHPLTGQNNLEFSCYGY